MRSLVLLTLANAALREESRTFKNVLEDYHRRVAVRGGQRGPAAGSLNPAAVKETFLFDCAQVVAVQFKEYLPHSAIRAVCDGSVKRTECLGHSDALVAEWKGETQDGFTNFTRWCDNFYEWFRVEHGHLCPEQCSKFMCMPRCAWLDQVADLDMREAELDKEDAAHGELKKTVEFKAQEVSEAASALNEREWRFNQTKKTLARRVSDLDELRTKHSTAYNATQDAEAKVGRLAQNISDLEAHLEELGDNKTQLGFAIDRAQLNVTATRRDANYAAENLAEIERDNAKLEAAAEKADAEVAEVNATWHEMVALINSTNNTAEAESRALFEQMDLVEERVAELKANETNLTAEMDAMALSPNTTGRQTAAKETELGMLKVELRTAMEKEQELVVKMAQAAKALKDVDREAFKATLLRKDLDQAEDAADAADAKVAGLNESLTTAGAEANGTETVAAEASEFYSNLTAQMGRDGAIATSIAAGAKKLKSLEVSADFAAKARDEKKAAEAAAAKDVNAMAEKVIGVEDQVAELAVEKTSEEEALETLRGKANRTAVEYAVATNATGAERAALDAERAAVEANETRV